MVALPSYISLLLLLCCVPPQFQEAVLKAPTAAPAAMTAQLEFLKQKVGPVAELGGRDFVCLDAGVHPCARVVARSARCRDSYVKHKVQRRD
jgi:hypothetical protein